MNEDLTEIEDSGLLYVKYRKGKKDKKTGETFYRWESKDVADDYNLDKGEKFISFEEHCKIQKELLAKLILVDGQRFDEISFDETEQSSKEILDSLDQPEINTQYLDIGESKGVWYYGFNLNGKEAIVTSNKKVFRNTFQKFRTQGETKTQGKNEIQTILNYDGYLSDIGYIWSRKSIKKFLTSPEKLDKKHYYKQIKSKIDYYMDFDKYKNSSTVQTCWILATYVYPLFYWFPHILINAPSGSGKSKNGFLLKELSFRGYDLGASAGVTPAQLFRTIEGNRGTMLLDEFEKTDSDTQKMVNQILNASATKDAYVIRTEQINKKWRSWKFPIFCPKIVCNITGINTTSLSRFIAFNLLKTQTAKGKRKPYKQQDKAQFKPLRDDLHILMMQNWKEIKEIYDSLELDLSNRDEDNWMPVCAIAKWIGEDVFNSVMEFIQSYNDLVIETNDITETVFYYMLENVTEEDRFYTPKEIAEWMQEELSMFKAPANFIGKKLTEFKFNKVRGGKGWRYNLSKKKIQDIIDRYFGTNKYTQTTLTTLNTLNTQTTSIKLKNSIIKDSFNDLINNSVVSVYSVVTPCLKSTLSKPSADEIISFFDENPKDNIDLAEQKWGSDMVKKLLNEGYIFEHSRGTLKALQ